MKIYTFHIPVVIHAGERVYVRASSEEEARELFEDQDWFDQTTDEMDRAYDFENAQLAEIEEDDDNA